MALIVYGRHLSAGEKKPTRREANLCVPASARVHPCSASIRHQSSVAGHRVHGPENAAAFGVVQKDKWATELLGLGLWGDGIPCNWDRTESVEVVALNLPGLAGKYHGLRLPITGVSRKQISRHTWHDLMKIISWSLQCCADGYWPSCRHDGTPWQEGDSKRASKRGSLGVQSCLVEVWGDWKFFGETFSFPKHNTNAGICWRCLCTPLQVITSCKHSFRGAFLFRSTLVENHSC